MTDFELACDTLFYCTFCQEEYMLPEDCEGCPICLSETLERCE